MFRFDKRSKNRENNYIEQMLKKNCCLKIEFYYEKIQIII